MYIDAHWSNRHYLRVICFNRSHSRRYYYYFFLIDQTCLSYLTSGAYLSMQLIYTFLWRIYFLSNLFCMVACTMCVCVFIICPSIPLFTYSSWYDWFVYSYFVLLFADSNLKRGKFNKTKKKATTTKKNNKHNERNSMTGWWKGFRHFLIACNTLERICSHMLIQMIWMLVITCRNFKLYRFLLLFQSYYDCLLDLFTTA